MDKQEMQKVGFPIMLLVLGIGLASFFTFVFLEIAEGVLENEVELFDSMIIELFKIIESETLNHVFMFITELGSVWFLTPMSILLIVTLWLTTRDKWGVIFFTLAIGGGALLTKIFKYYYGIERPSINPEIDAIGYSFPSGHSMGSLIFYGLVMYFVSKTKLSLVWKWILASLASVLILLIGLSRIYLGAHFPSDVISGYLAGAVWLIICIFSLEWMHWRSRSSVRPIRFIHKFLAKRF